MLVIASRGALFGPQLPTQLPWEIFASNNYIHNPVVAFVGANYPRDHPGG